MESYLQILHFTYFDELKLIDTYPFSLSSPPMFTLSRINTEAQSLPTTNFHFKKETLKNKIVQYLKNNLLDSLIWLI